MWVLSDGSHPKPSSCLCLVHLACSLLCSFPPAVPEHSSYGTHHFYLEKSIVLVEETDAVCPE